MEFKGIYTLEYYSEKVVHTVVVSVELRQSDGTLKPRQNIWQPRVMINGIEYTDDSIRNCVNARLLAEDIGHREKERIKKELGSQGKGFKIKKETLH